ncbi:hypothetical protein L2E82_16937 [Cichorium intybus]|uniref:Uncharacterized protein n=1 Tax=Cichorium intybus TaxID=13427 RepID=A0ACB9F6X3_CICIN|nr:hypothetical protein L2E82_16937 [Cichorium intybus]
MRKKKEKKKKKRKVKWSNLYTFLLTAATSDESFGLWPAWVLYIAILSVTSLAHFSPLSLVTPLNFVVGISMVKEGVKEWHRFLQDLEKGPSMPLQMALHSFAFTIMPNPRSKSALGVRIPHTPSGQQPETAPPLDRNAFPQHGFK